MKRILIAAACVAALSSAAARADTLDFSYTFGDNTSITGELTGTLVGDLVEGISNVHVWMNGVALNGPLQVGAWDSANGSFDTAVAPTLSTNAAQNNFIFADGSAPLGADTTNWFYMTNASDLLALGAPGVFAAQVDGTSAADDLANASWTLAPAPVPLPAAGLLFSSGLGLLGIFRRRRTAL